MAEPHSDLRMNSQLELSTCTSNSRTSSSSSIPSSPNNNPAAAVSPAPQAGDQSVSVVITFLPATSSTRAGAQVPLSYLSRKEALESLKESIPHRLKLQHLQKSAKEHQKDASAHKKTVRRLSKELYLIVSLYALMQGAVFAAVAQSSVFTCVDWWGPVGFAVAVMVGTIRGVVHKLRRMGYEKKQVRDFERRASAVYDRIVQLYWRGAACNIDELEPDRPDDLDAAGGREDLSSCIFSAQGQIVLGFLVIVSLQITVSCCVMLCQQPCRCNAGSASR